MSFVSDFWSNFVSELKDPSTWFEPPGYLPSQVFYQNADGSYTQTNVDNAISTGISDPNTPIGSVVVPIVNKVKSITDSIFSIPKWLKTAFWLVIAAVGLYLMIQLFIFIKRFFKRS